MAISVFKARALQVINSVAREHASVIITKRGKPLAQVVPFHTSDRKSKPGRLASTLIYEKDIVSPLGESMWEASA